jgi:hypothetical protein
MANTFFNATQITPPRVSIIDDRTGLVSREWYRYFYSLYAFTGGGTGILPIASGGTGLGAIPTDGQLLIGDGVGYKLHVIDTGSGIGITNGSGTILITNTGVLSNIAGSGIDVSSATGNVTLANTGVLSFSGGSTGLLPSSATTGAISLSGTLGVGYGGTGVTTSTGTSKTVLSSLPTFDTTIGVGGATASSSGSGISFPATQSASTNVNTLDDYEEGSWTPTNPEGIALTVTSAVYTKIGNLVTYQVRVAFAANADTNQASIVGFPFTPSGYDYPALIFSNSGAGASGFLPGAAQLLFYTINQSAILTNAQLAGVILRITGFYFV